MPSAAFFTKLELWTQLVWYEVRKLHVGSALGLFWMVVEPLVLLATYYTLFVLILKVNYGDRHGLEVIILMFSGLVPWIYFAGAVIGGVGVLQEHAPLIKHINFPIGILPFVAVAQASVATTIDLGLLLVLAAAIGVLSPAVLLLVPACLLLALFLVGVSAVVGCYIVLLPDIKKLLPAIVRVLVFLTPVLYTPNQMPETLRWVAIVNPLAYYVSLIRYSILGDPSLSLFNPWVDCVACVACTTVMLVLAFLHRDYVRTRIVDYL